MEESIVGIIPNVSTGLFGQKAYNLIVTDKRLIAAVMTSKMLSDAAKKQSEESKSRGEGFLKRMASTAFSHSHFHEKYFEMSPDEILSEHSENYYLDPSMIKKMSIKKGSNTDFEEKSNPHQLKIKSTKGKFTFSFSTITPKEVKNVLSSTFNGFI
jgi:hypothetical protein